MKSTTLTIRLSPEERAAWERAAALAGAARGEPVTLAEWVREACESATQRPPRSRDDVHRARHGTVDPVYDHPPSDDPDYWARPFAVHGGKRGPRQATETPEPCGACDYRVRSGDACRGHIEECPLNPDHRGRVRR